MYSDALTVSGMLTNFNGPNYHGIAYLLSKTATPHKSLVTGAQGGVGNGAVIVGDMSGKHREFGWQTWTLRNPDKDRQRVDGFKGFSHEERKRVDVKGIIQTHSESFEAAFERIAQTEQFDGLNIPGDNPFPDELGFQGLATMAQMNLDQEKSLLYSVKAVPADNTTAAKTDGMFSVATTNKISGRETAKDATVDATTDVITSNAHGYTNGESVFVSGTAIPGGLAADTRYFVRDAAANTFKVAATKGGAAIDITSTGTAVQVARAGKLTFDLLTQLTKSCLDNGGKEIGEGLVVELNTDQIQQINEEVLNRNIEPRDRTIYGVNVQTILTPFGPVNLLYNHLVDQGDVLAVNPTQVRLWHRFVPPHADIPGGITFTYDLGRGGNTTERVLYSSVGQEYGNEAAHGQIRDLAVAK